MPLPEGRTTRTPSPTGSGAIAALPPSSPGARSPLAGLAGPTFPADGWSDEEPPTVLGLGDGRADALELVTEPRRPTGLTPPPFDPRSEVARLLERARELQGLDDHTGAREILLRARELDPEDPGLSDALARSEAKLQTIYESKLGKLASVPRVRLREDEIIWLNLDHRAGFMLAQIDGTLSFEDLFSVSGMSRLDTARILAQLLDQRVIVRS